MKPSRALHLVVQAAGYMEVLNHVQRAHSMSIGRKWRVHVEFFFGRTANGGWWVRGLGLHIKDSLNSIATVNKELERERLQERYEIKNALAGIPARKAYFEIEKYSKDFDGDLRNGKAVTEILIEKAYEVAKGLAALPVNPIGPDPDDPASILLATAGAVIGSGTGIAGDHLKDVAWLKKLDYEPRAMFEWAKTAVDGGTRIYQRANDGSGFAALADLIDLGLELAKLSGPVAPLMSVVLGSMVDIAIANQAGAVTRVRSHMYTCFVSGVVYELTHETSVRRSREGDKVFFDYGVKCARKISPERRYDLQLAIMEYALRHPIGEWNLNPMYEGKPPFPDAYTRYWSPGMLERGLLTQFCKAKYLYK